MVVSSCACISGSVVAAACASSAAMAACNRWCSCACICASAAEVSAARSSASTSSSTLYVLSSTVSRSPPVSSAADSPVSMRCTVLPAAA